MAEQVKPFCVSCSQISGTSSEFEEVSGHLSDSNRIQFEYESSESSDSTENFQKYHPQCYRLFSALPSKYRPYMEYGATPTSSHQIAFRSIWMELLLRGHQITLITTDPINDPKLINLTEIDLSYSYKIWNKQVKEVTQSNIINSLLLMADVIGEIADYQLSHPLIQELIRNV
ncbi:hypothetical protein FQA39_LY09094 [Lamprigera yunnana]|nr:hypothetical protein FQA39_LY09094 [Lamprigera yunnana]